MKRAVVAVFMGALCVAQGVVPPSVDQLAKLKESSPEAYAAVQALLTPPTAAPEPPKKAELVAVERADSGLPPRVAAIMARRRARLHPQKRPAGLPEPGFEFSTNWGSVTAKAVPSAPRVQSAAKTALRGPYMRDLEDPRPAAALATRKAATTTAARRSVVERLAALSRKQPAARAVAPAVQDEELPDHLPMSKAPRKTASAAQTNSYLDAVGWVAAPVRDDGHDNAYLDALQGRPKVQAPVVVPAHHTEAGGNAYLDDILPPKYDLGMP